MSVVIGGIYEHYKGKRYKIVGVARHSETLEKLVVYQALYGNNELWVRPYSMFCETIVKADKEISRFKYLGDELEAMYKIQLELPDDLRVAFIENHIDIGNEIARNISNVTVEYEAENTQNHKKDISMVILAAGASVSAILLCISRLVRIVNERPREVQITEKNSEGDILKEETVLLEPEKARQKTEIDLEIGTQCIKFKILDEDK